MAPASCGSPQDTAGWLLRCCLNRPRALQPLHLWHPQSGFLQPEPAVLMAGAVDPPCQSSERSHSPRDNGGGGQCCLQQHPQFGKCHTMHNSSSPLQRVHVAQHNPWLSPSSARITAGTQAGLWHQPHCSPSVSRFPAVGGSVQDFTLTAPLLQSLCVSLLSKGTSDVCTLGGMVN